MEQRYNLLLNGKFYGRGPFDYMVELMTDYAKTCDMYGKDSVSYTIEKTKAPKPRPRKD